MSYFAQSTFIVPQTHTVRSHSIKFWISEHTRAVNAVIFFLLVATFSTYIVQVNSTASKGYQIRELENRIQALTVANQRMEREIQEAQSLQNITRAVKMIGMVEAEQPVYVGVVKPAYAFAK